jgi:hypothetical protein
LSSFLQFKKWAKMMPTARLFYVLEYCHAFCCSILQKARQYSSTKKNLARAGSQVKRMFGGRSAPLKCEDRSSYS